jgi:hypothetical protein
MHSFWTLAKIPSSAFGLPVNAGVPLHPRERFAKVLHVCFLQILEFTIILHESSRRRTRSAMFTTEEFPAAWRTRKDRVLRAGRAVTLNCSGCGQTKPSLFPVSLRPASWMDMP